MNSLNVAILLGRIGTKVKKYNTLGDRPFCVFPLALNERKANEETCTWVECEAWGDQATIIERMNIEVGQEMLIRGKLRTRGATTVTGPKLVVVVMDIKIFPKKPKDKEKDN